MGIDWVEDVSEFHRVVGGQEMPPSPVVLPPDDRHVDGRVRKVLEEVEELLAAVAVGDLHGIADGAVDATYVIIGLAQRYGIDLRPVWDEVHAANMRKVGGGVTADGRILKPDGWEPPDVAGVLAAQEYVGAFLRARQEWSPAPGEAHVLDGEVA